MIKNNVAWFCIRDGIETPSELAMLIGSSNDLAEAIINQEISIPHEYVLRMCDVFKCSADSLLCL